MSPRTVRRVVIGVFVLGIAGMIAGSIADNNGIAITFGIITAIAALGLILVTSVAPAEALRSRRAPTTVQDVPVDEEVAADVEARIAALVRAGADEIELRRLVQRAVELGRGPGRRR